jgi:hypothetical protein
MATSGTLNETRFNAVRVVDHAFRRCRLAAQQVTAEMQQYALESLYLLLSEWASVRTPSWCIERLVLPLRAGQPVVELPPGTVELLNLNLRVTQPLAPAVRVDALTSVTFDYGTAAQPVTVGVVWAGESVPFLIQSSNDSVLWDNVGEYLGGAAAGERTWSDLNTARPARYLRLLAAEPLLTSAVDTGALPQEIPFGMLNRDQYSNQSNKQFLGRPLTCWYQRERALHRLNLWPAPNAAAELNQLVVLRHRHIMDTVNLQQDVEVPARWLEAVVARLAARVGAETPAVDSTLLPMLDQKATAAELLAWAGDTDGSPTQIQPNIAAYTR